MRLLTVVLLLALASCAHESDADRFRAAAPKGFQCVIVEVGVNPFEEGLGSIYDYDEDGFGSADSDSVEVSLRTSSLSKLKSKLILGVGQTSIGLHSAKDKIEQVKEKDPPTERITFRAQREDDDMIFTVRLFTATQLGIVFIQENKNADLEELAKIDCRPGVSQPAFDEI